MKAKITSKDSLSLFQNRLENQLDPKHPYFKLAHRLPWKEIEATLSKYYSHTGRPAKPIRLMVSLMLLKHLENLGDETVVAQWVENPYWQYLSGEDFFQWHFPCDPTDLVYFRKRIGEQGAEFLFKVSAGLHELKLKEIVVDTTVQPNNITYPTDTKLYKKIITFLNKLAKKYKVKQRQSYVRVVKKLVMAQKFRRRKNGAKIANAAVRKIRTIAGRLLREMQRKLDFETLQAYQKHFELFSRALKQRRTDKDKVYSIHEPETFCIAKGKDHKKYEYGSKVSLAMTKDSAVIVGAMAFKKSPNDGLTLEPQLEQCRKLWGEAPEAVITDRGYQGKNKIGETQVVRPRKLSQNTTRYQKIKFRNQLRRRVAIEPVIGHLKQSHRMGRNYLLGSMGNSMNVLLAAMAFNTRKWMRKFFVFLENKWTELHFFLFQPKIF